MYNFRMLNRRPLALPKLDTLVPMVDIQFKHYTNEQVRQCLRQMPTLLYNASCGWYFALSATSIGKMPIASSEEKQDNTVAIHLSAVSNLDVLVKNAVLGYSKSEPQNRINSTGKEIAGNKRIKANHRFYVGAWINPKPYSVRLLIREYMDGTVELGEEAKAYALNIKEMRGFVPGDFSVFPASHGVTKALRNNPLIKDLATGNISVSSSRCGAVPPTDADLTEANVQTISDCSKISLKRLIESNLKNGEESLYRQRVAFDYSQTGTDRVETIFDRLRLTDEERRRLYAGEEIRVHNIKIRSNKIDATLSFRNGELKLSPMAEGASDKRFQTFFR